MSAVRRVFKQGAAPASGAASANTPSAAATPDSPADLTAITPPWRVRHARKLITAAAVLATLCAGYLGYREWQYNRNPLDRLTTTPSQAATPVAPSPATATLPAKPQPARPAVPSVTHIARDATPAPTVRAPAATVSAPAPAAAQPDSDGCAPGVVALGLCTSEARK